jgi:predicted DNA-binding protein (MmcQ/YjbR family)
MDRKGVKRVRLALKGVTLDHPWGDDHDVYKVCGQDVRDDRQHGGLSMKVSDIAFEVLTDSGRARPAPYIPRAKWVHLDNPNDWPKDELVAQLRAAHSLVVARLTKKIRPKLG